MDIVKLDELNVRILCEKDVAHEISDAFSFYVPGFRFMPSYKHGTWDRYDSFVLNKNTSVPTRLIRGFGEVGSFKRHSNQIGSNSLTIQIR